MIFKRVPQWYLPWVNSIMSGRSPLLYCALIFCCRCYTRMKLEFLLSLSFLRCFCFNTLVEGCRCSSDPFLSSTPRTGLGDTKTKERYESGFGLQSFRLHVTRQGKLENLVNILFLSNLFLSFLRSFCFNTLVEGCRCSSDPFLSSTPRTGLATADITG